MTQARIPGPLGHSPNSDVIETPSKGLSLRPGRRAPEADRPPGPVGLHVWNAPDLRCAEQRRQGCQHGIRRQSTHCGRHRS